MGAATNLAADKAGAFQRPDVLGGGRERDGEGLRQFTNGPLPFGQVAKHPATGGVAKGVKDQVQSGRIMFNHMVKYEIDDSDCQPIG